MASDVEKLMHHILSQFLARQDEIRVDLGADASEQAEELTVGYDTNLYDASGVPCGSGDTTERT